MSSPPAVPLALLLGPPGAGKSTQARRVAARLGWFALDFGHVVRGEVAARTPLGERVLAHRRARGEGPRPPGAWLPDDLVRDLLAAPLAAAQARGGLISDGYPRRRDQAETFAAPPWRIVAALHLVVPAAERERRLRERVIDLASGQIDRRAAQPTWDQRPEDAVPATLASRLADWDQDTLPLLEAYRAQGALVELDGTGDEALVTERVLAVLQERSA
ncbi:MAG: adenylate kinase family protein [Planctomycetota bacterium]